MLIARVPSEEQMPSSDHKPPCTLVGGDRYSPRRCWRELARRYIRRAKVADGWKSSSCEALSRQHYFSQSVRALVSLLNHSKHYPVVPESHNCKRTNRQTYMAVIFAKPGGTRCIPRMAETRKQDLLQLSSRLERRSRRAIAKMNRGGRRFDE